ncbi:MAG: YegP family protein, partial [Halobacteriota archaeon]
MAQGSTEKNTLVSFYSDRITEPSTDDEIYGYWLFALGLLASVVGVALFLYSSTLVTQRPSVQEPHAFWTVRQAAIVLAAGGVPLVLGGVAIRLPLRSLATKLAYLGVGICLLALVWFLTVYPAGWTFATGNTGVIGLYTVGLALIGLASVLVPMLSRAETETESERAAREQSERDRSELESDLETAREEREETRSEVDAVRAELESLQQSKARFEIYQDKGGGHRWRLRHRNGNIIA